MLQIDSTLVKRKDSEFAEVVPPNPYLHITQDSKSVYFQDGEFYLGRDEGPIEYDDVPDWFWDIVRRSYSPEYLEKFRLVLPENRKLEGEERDKHNIKSVNKMWKCKEKGCEEEVPMYAKSAHIARHARKKQRQLKQGE